MQSRIKNHVHGDRALLNRKGYYECASIVAEIDDSTDWEPLYDKNAEAFDKHTQIRNIMPDVTFCISDCDRSIRLDFEFYDKGERENNLYKVRQMIDVLTKFEQGLRIENERFEARILELEAFQQGLKTNNGKND